jgi:hypothetical protein
MQLPPPVLIEYLAEFRNLHVQIGFFDHPPRPHRHHDLVLRDHLALPPSQQPKQSNRARVERNRHAQGPLIQTVQDGVPAVEAKALEQKNVG